MPDFTKPPLSYYAPPGVVRVSPEALKMARRFYETVRRMPQVREPLVTFGWSTARSSRIRPDGPWEDVGPGLGLGAGERSAAPSEAIQAMDGLEFTIRIPREVYERSRQKLIDVDETAFEKLTLK